MLQYLISISISISSYISYDSGGSRYLDHIRWDQQYPGDSRSRPDTGERRASLTRFQQCLGSSTLGSRGLWDRSFPVSHSSTQLYMASNRPRCQHRSGSCRSPQDTEQLLWCLQSYYVGRMKIINTCFENNFLKVLICLTKTNTESGDEIKKNVFLKISLSLRNISATKINNFFSYLSFIKVTRTIIDILIQELTRRTVMPHRTRSVGSVIGGG